MESTVWLLLAYFAVLAVSLVYRRHTVRGPWFFLFRAFFPNWQFFHKVGPVPHLYVRFQNEAQSWSDWQWVYPRRQRHLLDVFHNSHGNLLLAQQNLVDHLSSDIKDLGEGADRLRRAEDLGAKCFDLGDRDFSLGEFFHLLAQLRRQITFSSSLGKAFFEKAENVFQGILRARIGID